MRIYISPSKGGQIFEIDLKLRNINILATISRRYEGYHKILLSMKPVTQSQGIKTIHDIITTKEEGLEQCLVYDKTLRWAFIDRFCKQSAEDILVFPYVYNVKKSGEIVTCFMKKETKLDNKLCLLEKSISLGSGESGFKVGYVIKNISKEELEGKFSTEINFTLLNPESFYYKEQRRNLGLITSPAEYDIEKSIGVYDRWNDLDINLMVSSPAKIYAYPVNTVSQSESGFEKILQGYAIVPFWEIKLLPQEQWGVMITYNIQQG
jgi:alpha-amylase